MKITFGGQYSIQEFGDAFDRALQTLQLNGADGVSKVSLYLNPTKERKFLFLRSAENPKQIIDHLEYDAPVTLEYRPIHHRIRPAGEDGTNETTEGNPA